MVVKEEVTLAGLGIVVGIAGALALSHLLTALLLVSSQMILAPFLPSVQRWLRSPFWSAGFRPAGQRGSTRSLSSATKEPNRSGFSSLQILSISRNSIRLELCFEPERSGLAAQNLFS